MILTPLFQSLKILNNRPGVVTAHQVLADILAYYGCMGRFYHNIEHIKSMFKLLETKELLLADIDSFYVAIAEHDVFYFPGYNENEERSVDIAKGHCRALGISKDRVEYICSLVMATKHEKTYLPQALESIRSRALVIEHLKKLRLSNVYLVDSLRDMLIVSVELFTNQRKLRPL